MVAGRGTADFLQGFGTWVAIYAPLYGSISLYIQVELLGISGFQKGKVGSCAGLIRMTLVSLYIWMFSH